MIKPSPFRYFKTSPEIIRLAVMLYVRFPLSLRNVDDMLHERGIEVSHEIMRFWWNRFGPMFATKIRKKRVQQLRAYSNWRWHLDEVFVKINGHRPRLAYLEHSVLGPRLIECTEATLRAQDWTLHQIFGSPDDLKFRSSMTLFCEAAGAETVFRQALDRYCDGQKDPATLKLLEG